jgi:hypothetical protein
LAKYLRNIESVNYRDYYDKLFEIFQFDQGPIGDHFREMKKMISWYLTTGEIKSDIIKTQRGDVIHFASHEFFFVNKSYCTEIGLKAFKHFSSNDHQIISLQRFYMYDQKQNLPAILESQIDINKWEHKISRYQISNLITKEKEFLNSKNKNKNFVIDFWALRRKNLIKNEIQLL